MPGLIARAFPVLAVAGVIWFLWYLVNRARSSPIRVTRTGVLSIVIVALLAVIAYLMVQ